MELKRQVVEIHPHVPERQVVETNPQGPERQVVERHSHDSEIQVVERHPHDSERQGEETLTVENVTIENTVNSEEDQVQRQELNNFSRRMILYSLCLPLAALSVEIRLLMAAGTIVIIIGLLILLVYYLNYGTL